MNPTALPTIRSFATESNESRLAVMQGVFEQVRPRIRPRKWHCINPLWSIGDGAVKAVKALATGWLYDAKEAALLLQLYATWVDASGTEYPPWRVWGLLSLKQHWVQTPDGTRIFSGDDLVAWREARWSAQELKQAMAAPDVAAAPRRKRL